MRRLNLIVLVIAMLAACATGVNVGELVQDINHETTPNQERVGAQRNLREDTRTGGPKDGATASAHEERQKKIPGLSTIASFFQKSPKVGKVLSKNPSLAKAMKDPQVVASLKTLERDASLVKSLKSSPLLKNPAKVLKTNPSKLTTKDVERIGATALRSTGISMEIPYRDGMLAGIGIVFVLLLIMGLSFAAGAN